MKTVEIKASGRYCVLIGRGLLQDAGRLIREASPQAERAAVITDDTVNALYGAALTSGLESAGFQVSVFVLPHGEESKNGENYLKILEFLAESLLSRSDMLVALGGGMTGDIAAFAAATYLRGISYVQIPTTLLAAVDSSVGGKTAIDLPSGKNLAGAFYQPCLVICDYDTLKTLPDGCFADGCAEVVKYGVLADEALFSHLEERGRGFDTEYVIGRCVEIKRDYVIQDEFDTGARRMLNLGHTLGHAIEAESAYKVSHGRAVATGMAVFARAAAKRGMCSGACADRICALLEKLHLPIKTAYAAQELAGHMLSDKKRLGGIVHVVVSEKIGRCRIEPMDIERLKEFVKAGL